MEPKPLKVVRTQVAETEPTAGEFAVVFSFKDGTEEFANVGNRNTAEWYARVQKGQDLVIGIFLLNAEKVEKLRRR